MFGPYEPVSRVFLQFKKRPRRRRCRPRREGRQLGRGRGREEERVGARREVQPSLMG